MTLELHNDELGASLTSLTDAPSGYAPTIYADALRQCGRDTGASTHRRSMLSRVRRAAPAIATAAAIVLVAGLVLPSLRNSRESAPAIVSEGAANYGFATPTDDHRKYKAPRDADGESAALVDRSGSLKQIEPPQDSMTAPLIDRIVIRKASVEIRTKDMNGTYAKVSLLLNEAVGEHIEDSRRAGEGASASATITIRVAASRMSEVMNSLRALGTVVSESTTGQDVTDQVVDLEARLRNEQRTEAELLKLMESRDGAPLTEILEVRKQVAVVREQIERLTAQRDRTKNLAALATIAVIISPEQATVVTVPDSSSPFVDGVKSAWTSGVRNLAGNVAWIVETAVAGTVWWIAIGAGALAVRAAFKQRQRTLSTEPAPRV